MDGRHQGRLLYLIGASGAGKDSLLDYARHRLADHAGVRFARRCITRPASSGGEDHIALSREAFLQRQAQGGFAMAWRSHGLDYGIGTEILDWLTQGLCVVVNGSRDYLPVAAAHFAAFEPVLLQVETDVLRSRLRARGRESVDQIDRRLALGAQRDAALCHPRLVRIDNNGALEAAGERLVALIRGEGP
jgi:ribose 1,5-bisphosphokinase